MLLLRVQLRFQPRRCQSSTKSGRVYARQFRFCQHPSRYPLKAHKNPCPVMLSSSAQASLTGRFSNSEYGRSKKAGEDLFLQYGEEVGAHILIYRFPNLFGKWCRPNYNSAIATFCNNIANNLPIQVNDRSIAMELLSTSTTS